MQCFFYVYLGGGLVHTLWEALRAHPEHTLDAGRASAHSRQRSCSIHAGCEESACGVRLHPSREKCSP